jgi:hypothetical protein
MVFAVNPPAGGNMTFDTFLQDAKDTNMGNRAERRRGSSGLRAVGAAVAASVIAGIFL